jgi:RNA polymerase sigma factor (sigma-70 family)
MLERYCAARDAGVDVRYLERKLVKEHTPLAMTVARRFSSADEDTRQAALVGLLQALRRFDPARGVELSNFAWPHIIGEIQRARIESAIVRVPRSSWRKGERVETGRCGHSVRRFVDTSSAFDDTLSDERVIDAVAGCWRGPDPRERCLAAAETMAASPVEGLWPDDPDERIEVLERLDFALDRLALEYPEDVRLWRAHYLDGREWMELAAELGVKRQRVQFRARRREPRLVEIIDELLEVPRREFVAWAAGHTPATEVHQ